MGNEENKLPENEEIIEETATEEIKEESAQTAENEAAPQEENTENEEAAAEETGEEDTAEETDEDSGEAEENADEMEEDDFSEEQPQESNEVTEQTEETEKVSIFKRINMKKILRICGIVVGSLALIYLAGVLFYSGHFMWGTEIGGFDCSNLSVDGAKRKIEQEIDNYTFTFYERDGSEEVITAKEIYLESAPVENLGELMAEQNKFLWFMPDNSHELPFTAEVTYNKDALYNRITEMKFMETSRKRMEGSVAKIKYEDGAYTVEDDGTDDVVSVNDMYEKIKPKIKELYKGMSMEKESCYTGLAGDDTMKGVLNLLNKFVSAKITYQNGEKSKTVDKEIIHDWLSVGEDYSVNVDEQKARDYINELSKDYDTVGKDRSFKTTGGDTITVSGGTYGWLMDNQKETEALLENIRNGETVEREPVYKQKAAAHSENDLSNTYVEVSIGAQHVWYYKDGNLEVSTDCVTGNTSLGRGTHTGAFYVVYKDKNVILKGQGYATPVTYWMPFYDGQGLHDATWRGSFGGSIYRGAGSHGCINLPYSAAQSLYSVISAGDPVIIY